ncbi:copper amine oxidase N-terminal domain-containing protein [Paenibacillus turpanensis]|uniref:copper amine oxidase N-terminal domain-containing protein n=1 Tax=Paenibacillus turpanensis TaxID=2689078 RepID=UPI0014091A9A|nr:copper amine oxidase N-terminal domain-containing protein [Paenibacillus turpanensis]
MKKWFKLFAALVLFVSIAPLHQASASSDITVYINGSQLNTDAPPMIENNSVLVPMRPLFEALGAEVAWIPETQTVVAELSHTKIEITIGRWIATKNGRDMGLAVPAVIKNQSTYVPLRFVGESLGAEVTWDAAARTVTISQESSIPKLEKVWSMGAPSEMYDWIQGFTIGSDQTLYAMDGIKVKRYREGTDEVFFNLQDLAPMLKSYGLDDQSTIQSFRLSDMQERDGRLYISGLMFVNKEGETYDYYKEKILLLGFSYNVIFYLENDQPTLLYVERAKVNEKPDNFTWYETKSGGPENFLQWGDFYLYDYSRYLLKLRFTFADDGSLIVPRELGQRHYKEVEGGGQQVNHSYHGIVKISPSGVVEELMSWGSHLGSIRKYSPIYTTNRHVLPVVKGNELRLYNGNGFIMDMKLDDGMTSFVEIPEEDSYNPVFLMERPLYHEGKVYFLNDHGIFTVTNGIPDMLVWADNIDYTGLDHTVYIVDFDYDGQYFYITDFTSRSIYRLKAQ